MNIQSILSLTLLALGFATERALAHGAAITYQNTAAIALSATYDSGQPMANARVIIYAPDNPRQVWQEGTTDSQGNYSFIPDRARVGNWHIAVRQAGHGATVDIPLQSDTARSTPLPTSQPPLTPLQKSLIAGSVVWGFVGTALYFSKGRK